MTYNPPLNDADRETRKLEGESFQEEQVGLSDAFVNDFKQALNEGPASLLFQAGNNWAFSNSSPKLTFEEANAKYGLEGTSSAFTADSGEITDYKARAVLTNYLDNLDYQAVEKQLDEQGVTGISR